MPGAWAIRAVLLLVGGLLFLGLWPALGSRALLVSAALFGIGLVAALYGIAERRRRPDEAPGAVHRLVALLVVAALGVLLAGGQFAYVLATRLTITEDAAACAPFAAVSSEEAAQRAIRAWGVDMLEFRTTVDAAAVNGTGWVFDAVCGATVSVGESRGYAVRWAVDGRDRFVWYLRASEEWGLLAVHAWVDWDTGECLDGCPR